MSRYFEVKAKPRHADVKFSFEVNCTQSCSYLYNCFEHLVPSYGEMAPFTPEILHEARENARKEIKNIDRLISEQKDYVDSLITMGRGAQTKEAVEGIFEEINDAQNVLREYEDDKRAYENCLVTISDLEDTMWLNAEWDFYAGIECTMPGEDVEE